MDLKLSINNQCNNYLVRLQQADNDSFAILLRWVLIVAAIALYLISVLSIRIGIFKTMATNSVFTASALFVYSLVVCSTIEEFWVRIKDLLKVILWGIAIYLAVFVFAIAITTMYYSSSLYIGKVLNEKMIQEIALNILAGVPVKFYAYSLLAFSSPFLLIALAFWLNRWLVFPLLRRFISKTLKESPNEPFKLLYFIVLVWSMAKVMHNNIFK